ncbi:unnamed protein product [Cuscuta campestris]|uniref:Uncharacterized protein n=1 Tax=Cuscuta campestris TaxID=132261 RepID=A0A484N0G1_9ASTE|nr:unnamed protein product [Cuscuta campestris]
MVQTRSNVPTTNHASGEGNSQGNGNGIGAITSTPVRDRGDCGVAPGCHRSPLCHWQERVCGTRATQAPGDPITEHVATSQHKGKKTRRSRRRSNKAPVIGKVLVEDIPEGEDEDSGEGGVSAFKQPGVRKLACRPSIGSTMGTTAAKAICAIKSQRAGKGTPKNRPPRMLAWVGPSVQTDVGTSEPNIAEAPRRQKRRDQGALQPTDTEDGNPFHAKGYVGTASSKFQAVVDQSLQRNDGPAGPPVEVLRFYGGDNSARRGEVPMFSRNVGGLSMRLVQPTSEENH